MLLLTHRIPYPPNKGDKIRSFNLLKHLARDYRVHLGTFIDDPDDWRYISNVRELCDETCFIGLRPFGARLRSLGALFSGEAMTLVYYRDRRLRDWVNRLLSVRNPQCILVFSSAMAQYVDGPVDPGVRRVLDFVDVDSDKWRQYSENHRWPMSWLYAREGSRLFSFERREASLFDASVFVSEAEATLFKREAPEVFDRVDHVENGVDTDYFAPSDTYPCPYGEREGVLVFTGAMDYRANVDAVAWFAHEVFPRVIARVPAARFYIVGARPAERVRRLAKRPGVRVTGAVTDIRPYLAHARAAVAPLRIARGVQNKVLEAMALARPVLATPQAMDGIRTCPGLEVLIADSAAELAERAVGLLNGSAYDVLGQVGRDCVLKHYHWATNLKRIEALLEGNRERTAEHGARDANASVGTA